jgi:transmembrane sensor
MQDSREIEDLLIQYLSGSASKEEREQVLAWIDKDPSHKKQYDELKKYYQLTYMAQKPSGFSIEKGWNRVRVGYYKQLYVNSTRDNKTERTRVIRQFLLPVAASLIVAFMAGSLLKDKWFAPVGKTSMAYNEIIVPLGAKSQVLLPDSTRVWLNAGSKLRYPAVFSKKNREVFLEGEAYFDVTKREKDLFVVNASDIQVKVYGTKFNVKAYPEEGEILTTLVSGSVSIDLKNIAGDNKTLWLKPNQTATIKKTPEFQFADKTSTIAPPDAIASVHALDSLVLVKSMDTEPITSWKDSIWVIRGEELEKLAIKLERRFNVKISFEDEGIKKYKFSGSLIEETFEQVINIIQASAPVKYTIENNHVKLREDKQYKKKYDMMLRPTS